MIKNKVKLQQRIKRSLLDFTEDEKHIEEQKQKTKQALDNLRRVTDLKVRRKHYVS